MSGTGLQTPVKGNFRSGYRGTIGGERDYREQLSLLPARQQVIERERDLKIEEGSLGSYEDMRRKMEQRKTTLEADYMKRGKEIENNRHELPVGERVKLFADQRDSRDNIEKATQELKDLDQRIEQQRGRVIGLKAEVGQAKIGVSRGELGILENREAVAQNQAQNIGLKSNLDIAIGKQAYEMAKKFGFDAMPPDMIQQAFGLDREGMMKMAEERGQKKIEEFGLRKLGGGFRDNLNEAREKVDAGRNNVIDEEQKLGQRIANEADKKLLTQGFADKIVKAASDMMDKKVDALKVKLLEGFARGQAGK